MLVQNRPLIHHLLQLQLLLQPRRFLTAGVLEETNNGMMIVKEEETITIGVVEMDLLLDTNSTKPVMDMTTTATTVVLETGLQRMVLEMVIEVETNRDDTTVCMIDLRRHGTSMLTMATPQMVKTEGVPLTSTIKGVRTTTEAVGGTGIVSRTMNRVVEMDNRILISTAMGPIATIIVHLMMDTDEMGETQDLRAVAWLLLIVEARHRNDLAIPHPHRLPI
mmetsp:Transcript_7709/g.11026  ORF Transcript_7709/g.11026 Transcript_7709/m.11026 type:complete len:221 (+) Transcript_7709:544-1206(+)